VFDYSVIESKSAMLHISVKGEVSESRLFGKMMWVFKPNNTPLPERRPNLHDSVYQ